TDKAIAIAESQQLPRFPRIVLVSKLHIMGRVFSDPSLIERTGRTAVELQLLIFSSIGGISLYIHFFRELGGASPTDAYTISFEGIETVGMFHGAELHRTSIHIALRKQIPQL